MSTTYKTKRHPPKEAQLALGLFSQENGDPFSLIDPLPLATAITLLVYNHLVAGSFGNNLACLRCGRCALSVRRETLETGVCECGKCGRAERFGFDGAYQYYMTMHPEKVRRVHAQGMQDEEDHGQKSGGRLRIELPMAHAPTAVPA